MKPARSYNVQVEEAQRDIQFVLEMRKDRTAPELLALMQEKVRLALDGVKMPEGAK